MPSESDHAELHGVSDEQDDGDGDDGGKSEQKRCLSTKFLWDSNVWSVSEHRDYFTRKRLKSE